MNLPEATARTPKVSVVIPCYNRERYVGQEIGRAVQSVLVPTWSQVTLSERDDGSAWAAGYRVCR